MAEMIEVKHEEQRHPRADGGDTLSVCYCGAQWSHPPNRPVAVMDSIFESHVKGSKAKAVIRD